MSRKLLILIPFGNLISDPEKLLDGIEMFSKRLVFVECLFSGDRGSTCTPTHTHTHRNTHTQSHNHTHTHILCSAICE